MARLLDRLPVEALYRLADPAWLDGIGCRTVGEVRALPRAALKRRGAGPAGGAGPGVWRGAGQPAWFVAPPVFARRMDLPGRIEGAEGVLAGAQRLLLAMAGWLAGQQQAGATRFVLVLEHERYRAGEAPQGTPVEVALAQPAAIPNTCRSCCRSAWASCASVRRWSAWV